MRLCRFRHQGTVAAGFYDERSVVPVAAAAARFAEAVHEPLNLPTGDDLLALLPPAGAGYAAARRLAEWVAKHGDLLPAAAVATESVELLVPIPPQQTALVGRQLRQAH